MIKYFVVILLCLFTFCNDRIGSDSQVTDLGKIKIGENLWLQKITVTNASGVCDKVYFLINDSNTVVAGATTFQGKGDGESVTSLKWNSK